MKPTDVIKTSILSEKAYKLMENGIYTFLVDKRSTKNQIVKAVENQFAVNVIRVNVSKKSFKMKRIGRTRKQAKVGGGKKAIVYLKTGQNIAILSPKSKKETKSIKKAEGSERSRRDKDVQKVSAEGKEG